VHPTGNPCPDATLRPDFLPASEADALLAVFLAHLAWRQDTVRLFGRAHPIPRLHQWYGDPGCDYRWSGLSLTPLPWPPALAELRDRVAEASGAPFNCALANLYRDGRDAMGWHADDEPELGGVVASVSLGAVRDFALRSRVDDRRVTLPLPHGSLLVMADGCQQRWQHALPRRLRVTTPRVNLTFRWRRLSGDGRVPPPR
jgi:alkylated DNA repair dioxygenase AlkB